MTPNDIIALLVAALALALFLRAPKDGGSKAAAIVVMVAVGGVAINRHLPSLQQYTDPWLPVLLATIGLGASLVLGARHNDRVLAAILVAVAGIAVSPVAVRLLGSV